METVYEKEEGKSTTVYKEFGEEYVSIKFAVNFY
jgi:hypothetical protein